MLRAALPVLISSLLVTACGGGGDDDGGDGGDGGDDGGAVDAGGDAVAGTARFLKGPSGGAALLAAPGGVSSAADGHWFITPQEAELTLASITFMRDDNQPAVSTFSDCTPVYSEDAATLSPILDCPFSIPPGTYLSVSIGVSTTAQVTIADPVNGIFTDPETATGLSPTEPAGGPAASTLTVAGPGGEGDVIAQGAFFEPPLVVEADQDPITVSIVQDMIHTVFVDVSAGGATIAFDDSLPLPPAQFIPSLGGAGRVEYYSPNDGVTAANYFLGPGGTGNAAGSVRIFFPDDSDQPASLWHVVNGPSEAYAADPAATLEGAGGARAGGYLGVDADGNACWALPVDFTYQSYNMVCVMPLATAIGATTTLSCWTTSVAPAPAEGATYASGCPAITPDMTSTMTLVGR